jgi:hypothetical protein
MREYLKKLIFVQESLFLSFLVQNKLFVGFQTTIFTVFCVFQTPRLTLQLIYS